MHWLMTLRAKLRLLCPGLDFVDLVESSVAAFSMTMMMNVGDVELISGTLAGFDKAADSGRTGDVRSMPAS